MMGGDIEDAILIDRGDSRTQRDRYSGVDQPGDGGRRPRTPLAVWQVEHEGDRVFVRQKREPQKPRGKGPVDAPGKIVIVGGGAAGFAAADMLRRQEFGGGIVMLSNDAAPPVDRPNLSKDYLAGSAPEDWLPLRPDSFYAE